MQLNIRDLTNLLDVPEATVSQWIRERGLPARRAGRYYRVNRTELLGWTTAHNVKVSLLLFDHLDADASAVPGLAEALEAGGIHYGLPNGDKDRALSSLVKVLPGPSDGDRESLLRLFLARESSASTSIGDGIAIPHVRHPIILQVFRPTVTLAFLEHPVDFGAADGKPVGALFAIVSPTNRGHLQLLSRLSLGLHDAGFREAVARKAPRDQILGELRRVEACMSVSAADNGTSGR